MPIEHQPDFAQMLATVKEARAKRPTDSKALLAIKQGPIDATLAGDLVASDWYLAGAWSYPEKKFGPTYLDEEVLQYDVRRVLPEGGQLSYSLVLNAQTRDRGQVVHTNFTLPPDVTVGVERVGKDTYLAMVAYGAKELHRVVSYEKGVLIVDVSYDGVARSKKVKFRDVWVAMPRRFESTGK
ncbi:MAG: hypothetical protein U0228_15595 [Myxococcaceae bacterium]